MFRTSNSNKGSLAATNCHVALRSEMGNRPVHDIYINNIKKQKIDK